jgi:hypothetical protein
MRFLKGAIVIPLAASAVFAQPPRARPGFDAFEVATIKPTPPDWPGLARYMRMQTAHQFAAKNLHAESDFVGGV